MAVDKLWHQWQGLSRFQRWGFITACSLLLYAVFGFWLLPVVVRSQLEKKLTAALHRQTMVREVKFNPFTLEAVVNGFTIEERAGREPFVAFDALRVNLQAASLYRRALILKSFSLVNPSARIILNSDRSLNFSDLLPADPDPEIAKKKDGEMEKPFLFSINNIDLSGGRIDFEDRVKDAAHRITGLHIALPFLSTLPYEIEIFTRPVFEAVVNGTPLNMAGESKPFFRTKESKVDVRFHDIDLTDYLVYLPEHLNFTIRNGRLNLDLSLSFMQHDDGGPAINIAGKTSLRDMQVVDRLGQPLLSFPELTVDIGRAHLLRREFHLAGIVWRKPELFVQREEDGRFNLALSVASPAGKKMRDAPASPSGGLLFEVAEAALEAATIHFTDRTVSGPMQTTMKPVNLQVKNFSTAPDTSASFNLALASESGESVGVIGAFTLVPLNVAADAVMENVRLDKYRPYYEHALRGEITADRVRAAAHVDYAGTGKNLLVSGLEAELVGFGMTGPDGSDKVVIPAFSIAGTEVNLRDRTVTVDRCASRGGVIPVIRRGDGTVNLQDFLAPAPVDPGKPEEMVEKDEAPPAA